MGMYRKKPVVVDARQFTGGAGPELAQWCQGRFTINYHATPANASIDVLTREGRVSVSRGDWIVQEEPGVFAVYSPDVFAATYEVAV